MDRLFLAIAALHPLRLEEVLGLRSEDIDIENRLIHIRRGVTHPDNNRPHVDETKTSASVRTISLAKLAVPHIPILKKGQYLFGGNDPITYQKRVLMCKRIQEDTKFDGKVTPARFRTTVLTDIYDQTKDIKLTQQAAGHTSPKMTLERYVKGRSDLNKAAEVINATYSAQLENSWAG